MNELFGLKIPLAVMEKTAGGPRARHPHHRTVKPHGGNVWFSQFLISQQHVHPLHRSAVGASKLETRRTGEFLTLLFLILKLITLHNLANDNQWRGFGVLGFWGSHSCYFDCD